jgi:hypothetical protein
MKTNLHLRKNLLLLCGTAFCLAASNLPAQSPVILQADLNQPGRMIPADFCGLSYEIKLVLTNSNTGRHYFRPDNRPLINLFQTLGIKQLRVGGNTAERSSVPIPDKPDIDSFFGFVKAAGVKAIYTVRMESNSPAAAAEVAKYVMDHYQPCVSCFTVGNEPDKVWKYPAYLEEWKQFTATILSPEYAPDAKFCGPSATQSAVEWAKNFANDMGGWKHLAYVTQHFYPCRNADSVTNEARAAEGRARLLSPGMYSVYQKFYDVFGPAAKAKGIGFRLEEGNSYSHGGAPGVSDTCTASLWIVDYLYWWAWHDALGLNFHTGEKVLRGQPGPDKPNVYTAFTSSPKGYTVLPTGYGMKLFNLGSQGRLVPVTVVSNTDNVNLAAYATLAADKTLYLTILNKEFGATGRAAKVTLRSGMTAARVGMISMLAPNDDITAVSGITIGGEPIKENGKWSGKWSRLPAVAKDGFVTVTVPAASAMVIRLRGK